MLKEDSTTNRSEGRHCRAMTPAITRSSGTWTLKTYIVLTKVNRCPLELESRVTVNLALLSGLRAIRKIDSLI